jgi:hypothetical protein
VLRFFCAGELLTLITLGQCLFKPRLSLFHALLLAFLSVLVCALCHQDLILSMCLFVTSTLFHSKFVGFLGVPHALISCICVIDSITLLNCLRVHELSFLLASWFRCTIAFLNPCFVFCSRFFLALFLCGWVVNP